MTDGVIAVIIGNRDFFSDVPVAETRNELINLFGELGIQTVMMTPQESKLGAAENWQDAKRRGEFVQEERGPDGHHPCLCG
jgi:hypothetical protein